MSRYCGWIRFALGGLVLLACLSGFLALPGFCVVPAGAAELAYVALFGAPETLAPQNPYAARWQRVVDAERAHSGITSEGRGMNPVEARQWRNLLAFAKESDWTQKLRLVNGFFNGWNNIQDIDAWGQGEHWATPEEFIRLRGGDCEDYAIAKYYTLRRLGIAPELMRVVVIRALDERGKPHEQLHAVLAVRARNNWFILDRNVRPREAILPQDHYKGRFVPLFSMNEKQAWKHLPDPQGALPPGPPPGGLSPPGPPR